MVRGLPERLASAGTMAGMNEVNQARGKMVSFSPVASRGEVTPLVKGLLKRGQGWFAPDVFLIDWQGNPAVWKDYGHRNLLGRLWGRLVIGREARALMLLRGVVGVPQLFALVKPTGLVMEFFEGDVLPRKEVRSKVTPDFFAQVFSLLTEIHARGVAHGDIRRKNIMVLRTGAPALIDFQTAFLWGRFPWKKGMFGLMCKVDRWNLIRIKARSFPRYLTPDERAFLENPPFLLRVGRFLRRKVYRRWRNNKHDD